MPHYFGPESLTPKIATTPISAHNTVQRPEAFKRRQPWETTARPPKGSEYPRGERSKGRGGPRRDRTTKTRLRNPRHDAGAASRVPRSQSGAYCSIRVSWFIGQRLQLELRRGDGSVNRLQASPSAFLLATKNARHVHSRPICILRSRRPPLNRKRPPWFQLPPSLNQGSPRRFDFRQRHPVDGCATSENKVEVRETAAKAPRGNEERANTSARRLYEKSAHVL